MGVEYDLDNSNKAPHFCHNEWCHYQFTTFDMELYRSLDPEEVRNIFSLMRF